MDFLVMLEDPAESAPLARVDSVPEGESSSSPVRDVVTLYGTPRVESLALALAAAVESHRRVPVGSSAMHLGLWPERGAVGDTAFRDSTTGELVTRDLLIPLEVLTATADGLLDGVRDVAAKARRRARDAGLARGSVARDLPHPPATGVGRRRGSAR